MITAGLSIAVFGSNLVSEGWSPAATSCRALLRALAARGHSITVYEPDAHGGQQHRVPVDSGWTQNVVYSPELAAAQRMIKQARAADIVIKASGVGILDDYLEAAVADLRDLSRLVVFWDVDARATLERLLSSPLEPLLQVIPLFDLVLTNGGASAVDAYTALGARNCQPIYQALDPETLCLAPPDPEDTYEHRAAEVEAILLAAQRYSPSRVIPSTSLPTLGIEPVAAKPYFIY